MGHSQYKNYHAENKHFHHPASQYSTIFILVYLYHVATGFTFCGLLLNIKRHHIISSASAPATANAIVPHVLAMW